MSHFTVIVIGENPDLQLAPYSEEDFEPQYGVFEDTEEQDLLDYKEKPVEVVDMPDGSVLYYRDDVFAKIDPKTYQYEYTYPEGAVIRQGSFKELYSTFEEYMKKYNGISQRDPQKGRYGYWCNPNAKWDWYSIGGRWTGYFKLKQGAEGTLGRPGVFGNKPSDGWVDVVKLKDIDFEGMFEQSIKEANETYDEIDRVLKGRSLPSWRAIRDKHGTNIEAARLEYNSLEVVQDMGKANIFAFDGLAETFCNSRQDYVQKRKNQTMVPYAMVMDGKWYQKGQMGWFGVSTNEMDDDQWNQEFWNIIFSLDPETQLTLIDCHI